MHMRDAASFGPGRSDGPTAWPTWLVHVGMFVFDVTNEIAIIPKDIPTTVW